MKCQASCTTETVVAALAQMKTRISRGFRRRARVVFRISMPLAYSRWILSYLRDMI
jgi:hypothetical protein